MSSSEEFDDSMSDASIGDYDMDDDFMAPDIDDVESMASDEDDIVGALTADLTEEEQALLEASMVNEEETGLRRSRRQRKVVERYEDPDFVRLMSDNGKDLPGYFDEMDEDESAPDSTYIESEEEESEFSAASEH